MAGALNAKFWTLVAPVYSVVVSMLEMTWCVQLLYTSAASGHNRNWSPWNVMQEIQDPEIVKNFTWVSFALHLVWFAASLVMIYENMTDKNRAIMFWMISTALVTLWSTISATFFIVKYKNAKRIFDGQHDSAYLVLFVLYSGGLFFWLVNISLMLILGKQFMASCSSLQQINNPKGGMYGRLKNSNSSVNSCQLNDDNLGFHLEDVIFDASRLPSDNIFHIKNVKTSNISGI